MKIKSTKKFSLKTKATENINVQTTISIKIMNKFPHSKRG